MTQIIQLGDIFTYCFAPDRSSDCIRGLRPVVVVKSEPMSRLVNIVPLTSNTRKSRYSRHIRLEGHGLNMPSFTLVEQICTVDKRRLGRYIGSIRGKPELERILDSISEYFRPNAA